MALYKITRDELAAIDYGRGADSIIRGAKFAAIQHENHENSHVWATHRTEEAAAKTVRRARRLGYGRVYVHEIIEA